MIPVKVAKLGLDSAANAYVVVLQELDGERVLRIWIGRPEAESIAMHINDVQRDRPITHDLCVSLLTGLGATLRRAQVTHVHEGTFFAELHLVRSGAAVIIDSRPSDAIAIALRLDAPLFVHEALFEGGEGEAARESGAGDGGVLSAEQLQHILEQMRPEDFGRFSL